jgi:hypothetical protein
MVEVIVDPSTLRPSTLSGNVTGIIYLCTGAEHFPDAQWSDFPVIVLGWWIAGLLKIVHGGAGAFESFFMAGPYAFVVEATGGAGASITLRSREAAAHVLPIDVRALLVSAAAAGAEVAHACRAAGWLNDDLRRIEALVARVAS